MIEGENETAIRAHAQSLIAAARQDFGGRS
jgi:hypothetical protein